MHIYGASGSGTTTLGRKISEELGYKLMDTDDYFWLPTNPKYTTKRGKEERIVTDTDIRIERLKLREKKHFGERIMPGGDMYEHHMEFIEWAREYDTGSVNMRSKAKHDEWEKLLLCRQIVLNGTDDLDENFKKVQAEISSVIG
ncbi:MAG: shikimate kinase [Lachnospiraceae bacterium]|nr:shikimate kinase [Lachnospiraceae bacterium]